MKKLNFLKTILAISIIAFFGACSSDENEANVKNSFNIKLNGNNYPLNHKLGVEAKATNTGPAIVAWISTLSVNLNFDAPLSITPASSSNLLCAFTSTNLAGLGNKVINISFLDSQNYPMYNGIENGNYTSNANSSNEKAFSFMILDNSLPNGYAYPVEGSAITLTKNSSRTSVNLKGSFSLKDNNGNINQTFSFPSEGIDIPYSNCQ